MEQEAEFRAFVQGRYLALLRLAFLLCGDRGTAEDLVQTALARVYRRWDAIERRESPEAYVRRAVVNASRDWWRIRYREPRLVELIDDPRPAPDRIGAADDRDEMWRALHRLPRQMRAVLVLRFYEDMTEAQIATTLGCSTGTVKSQLSRGLDRLRRQLREDLAEQERR